jgi:hypothetical protein
MTERRLHGSGKVVAHIDHPVSPTAKSNGAHNNHIGGVTDGQVPLLAAEDINGNGSTPVVKPPSAPFYLFLPPAFLDLFGITSHPHRSHPYVVTAMTYLSLFINQVPHLARLVYCMSTHL